MHEPSLSRLTLTVYDARALLAQVPLAPPEDILSWLTRIGLLEKEDAVAEEEDGFGGGDNLLDDEFDLDDDGAAPAAESTL